ncbi:MAG: hypothetical protein ACK5U0_18210 [Gemmatimonas sp.]|nr:hypothetical protein [Gemmatimonas sp.]MCA2983014.1 hypothetical protein [Gemmatimonas sp.]MCA2990848.1 hypothetical protein [Gemmatimonas sp.]MCA2996934.1 hypothetical protein [Gemmatimonas sp.]MCZ8012144.1 hypothetical protein [Gemmatimonas sp.]
MLLVPRSAFAYYFNEHEVIGNAAMSMFLRSRGAATSPFWRLLPLTYDSASATYAFPLLSRYQTSIGYGTINALSGDHTVSPLALQEHLLTPNSRVLRVIALQKQFAAAHYASAPDGDLAKLDPAYLTLAMRNQSHFYWYGKGASENLAPFDSADIDRLLSPAHAQAVLHRLHGTNALTMYVTLHAAAIRAAEKAGREPDEVASREWLHYAFLYNGFADHFLQDAFSSGHLLVRRTMLTMLVNNKSLHDFYSKYGTRVVNANGEIWTAFGDAAFNQPHGAYLADGSIRDIRYPLLTPEAQRIVNAVAASLGDLADAFERGRSLADDSLTRASIVPSSPTSRTSDFFRQYRSLSHVPLPYGTVLKDLMPDSLARRADIQRANQMPYLRDFVRSRVANSVVLDFTTVAVTAPEIYQGIDLRLNLGLLRSAYRFNDQGTKRGQLDSWHGYTASYGRGRVVSPQDTAGSWALRVGIRSHFDYWVSNERFAGLFVYSEIGMDRRANKTAFAFTPQAGVQLGSLLKLNYYSMPVWARVPAQLFLPLKFRAGTIVAAGRRPTPFSGLEIDLLF